MVSLHLAHGEGYHQPSSSPHFFPRFWICPTQTWKTKKKLQTCLLTKYHSRKREREKESTCFLISGSSRCAVSVVFSESRNSMHVFSLSSSRSSPKLQKINKVQWLLNEIITLELNSLSRTLLVYGKKMNWPIDDRKKNIFLWEDVFCLYGFENTASNSLVFAFVHTKP